MLAWSVNLASGVPACDLHALGMAWQNVRSTCQYTLKGSIRGVLFHHQVEKS